MKDSELQTAILVGCLNRTLGRLQQNRGKPLSRPFVQLCSDFAQCSHEPHSMLLILKDGEGVAALTTFAAMLLDEYLSFLEAPSLIAAIEQDETFRSIMGASKPSLERALRTVLTLVLGSSLAWSKSAIDSTAELNLLRENIQRAKRYSLSPFDGMDSKSSKDGSGDRIVINNSAAKCKNCGAIFPASDERCPSCGR